MEVISVSFLCAFFLSLSLSKWVVNPFHGYMNIFSSIRLIGNAWRWLYACISKHTHYTCTYIMYRTRIQISTNTKLMRFQWFDRYYLSSIVTLLLCIYVPVKVIHFYCTYILATHNIVIHCGHIAFFLFFFIFSSCVVGTKYFWFGG